MFRVFLFLVGFSFMLLGFSTIVLYINLLSFGYTFKEYVIFIIKSSEFIFLIIGFIIINISIFIKGDKKNEIHLWYPC